MLELTAENAIEYLVAGGHARPGESISVRELSGGVSNVVLLVEVTARNERFVMKQARGRLRVQEEWLCPIERIWREVETLRICAELITPLRIAGCGLRMEVPDVLWDDRANFCFAMTAAPPEHKTWKELLLVGNLDSAADIARTCGEMLAILHGSTWGNSRIASQQGDRTFFDLLRIDPYYRHIAKVHPDLAPQIQRLIDSVWLHRQCLVHGDFSPKNLLVWPGHVMLIDCEVGHYGDPAFDLGFFLTHLFLKAIRARNLYSNYLDLAKLFWSSYSGDMISRLSTSELDELECRTVWNLAGCMCARVDGKSPVDYLTAAERDAVRELSRRWLVVPPTSIEEALAQVANCTE